MNVNNLLSDNHWTREKYRQRMKVSEWKQFLLNNGDSIIYHGTSVSLKAKNVGYGVVEVYKDVKKK